MYLMILDNHFKYKIKMDNNLNNIKFKILKIQILWLLNVHNKNILNLEILKKLLLKKFKEWIK